MADQNDDREDHRDEGSPLERLIGTLRANELSALESVREFVDTVDAALPSLVDDAPRRRIIDAAFRMTEQLVGASNQLATNVVKVTESALGDLERSGAGLEPQARTRAMPASVGQ